MKVAYLDLSCGVSGEMVLGALVDLGVDPASLRQALAPLAIPSLDLQVQTVQRGGLAATRVQLQAGESPSRVVTAENLPEITETAGIPGTVARRVEGTLSRWADAEAHVRGVELSQVKFTNKTVAETIAVLLGFDLLAVDRVLASEIRLGRGSIQEDDAAEAVPALVVSRLLVGFRVSAGPVEGSLVTPAGAALVREMADGSVSLQSMRLLGVGVGAGDFESETHPHILRILTGQMGSGLRDEVIVIESQIDDMSPEAYDILLEDAFRAGALDVMFTAVQMKKNRPGTLVTVLAPVGREEVLAELVLRESTTLGVRLQRVERRILERESVTVQTPWGPVRGKVVGGPGVERRFKPEYEDCRRIHRERSVPFLEVAAAAQRAFENSAGWESETNSEGKACPSCGTRNFGLA